MKEPRIIPKLRRIADGAWDMGMADFSSNALEAALEWAIHNDGEIASIIEDELNFRRMD